MISIFKKFLRLFPLLQKRRGAILGSLILSGSITIISVTVPQVFRHIVDDIVNGNGFRRVVYLGLLFVVLALVRSILSIFQSRLNNRLSKEFTTDLRTKTLNNLLRGKLINLESTTVGKTVNIIMSDTSDVCSLLCGTCIPRVLDILMVIGLLCALFNTNWILTLCVLASVPLQAFGSTLYRERRNTLVEQQRLHNHRTSGRLTERLRSVRLVKVAAKEDDEMSFFSDAFLQSNIFAYRINDIKSVINAVNDVASKLSSVFLFAFGGWLVLQHSISFGKLVEYIAYVGMVQESLLKLINVPLAFVDARPAIECLHATLYDAEQLEPDSGRDFGKIRGTMEFHDVRFSYPLPNPPGGKGRLVIHGANFTIQAGEMVAILGANGSGKSTLASLLARFYDPCAGSILIDGHNIALYSRHSLRRQMGYLEQDSRLFKGTLRENITYLAPSATDAEIQNVAELLGIDLFLNRMPEGWNTLVGETGVTLSGGQRQRIAMARMLLARPRIILLDEALSSIDKESEIRIFERLKGLEDRPTVIAISHNPAVMPMFDRIFRVEDGNIRPESAGFSTPLSSSCVLASDAS